MCAFFSTPLSVSSENMDKGKMFEFEWKANRNFCVTKKCELCFDTELADEFRDQDKFFEFALLQEHPDIFDCEFVLVGYYKTEKAATEAMHYIDGWVFLWNRKGECINGCY